MLTNLNTWKGFVHETKKKNQNKSNKEIKKTCNQYMHIYKYTIDSDIIVIRMCISAHIYIELQPHFMTKFYF